MSSLPTIEVLRGGFCGYDRVPARSCVTSADKNERQTKNTGDIARGLAQRARAHAASGEGAWRRETYTLERGEARAKARAYFAKFPKAAYMTEIESWRELSGGRIAFTIRRRPSAD